MGPSSSETERAGKYIFPVNAIVRAYGPADLPKSRPRPPQRLPTATVPPAAPARPAEISTPTAEERLGEHCVPDCDRVVIATPCPRKAPTSCRERGTTQTAGSAWNPPAGSRFRACSKGRGLSPPVPGALRRNPHAAAGTAEERSPTISSLPAAARASGTHQHGLEAIRRWSRGWGRLQIRTRCREVWPRGPSHLHPS